MKFFKNTKALVLGASGGIGEAVAKKMATSGVNVTLAARTEAKLKNVLSSLEGEGHSYFCVDTTSTESVQSLCAHLKSTGPYTVFINNSGGPKGGALLSAEAKAFKDSFKAHVLSAQEILKILVPQMKLEGRGRLVNIISTSVKISIPNLGVSNTIRGAVASWAKTLSMELGRDNITVNNVLPGYTQTDRLKELVAASSKKQEVSVEEIHRLWKGRVPMGRFAKPLEVANVVCFLASNEASYVNGVSVPVDGGRTGSI